MRLRPIGGFSFQAFEYLNRVPLLLSFQITQSCAHLQLLPALSSESHAARSPCPAQQSWTQQGRGHS